jgi:guanine deaminase
VTPRFAATSSPEQLAAAGALLAAHPDVYLQTHLAETQDELAWVRRLYPEAVDYLDVYARHGLVGRRSVFGHGIHLPEDGWQRLHDAGAAVAHCPTSNNFLGSGHFRMADAKRAGRAVRVALATDVGGGTHAVDVRHHERERTRSPPRGFRAQPGAGLLAGHARCGAGARPGRPHRCAGAGQRRRPRRARPRRHAAPVWRIPFCESIEDVLAVLMMLGDDRLVAATYAGGRLVHRR